MYATLQAQPVPPPSPILVPEILIENWDDTDLDTQSGSGSELEFSPDNSDFEN